jgi:hypothetical protein
MRLMFSRRGKKPPKHPSTMNDVITCKYCPSPPVDIIVWPDDIEEPLCEDHLDFINEMNQAIEMLEANT